MAWFWTAAIIGFLTLELSTLKMFFGFFALGASSSLIAKLSLPTIAIGWQLLIFALSTAFLIFAVRPLVKKLITKYKKK